MNPEDIKLASPCYGCSCAGNCAERYGEPCPEKLAFDRIILAARIDAKALMAGARIALDCDQLECDEMTCRYGDGKCEARGLVERRRQQATKQLEEESE